uniref:C-C motif chemokine n=1 Tax=Acanthochromis polyacanthus TaxID=80966 RepID=A0A3Q1G8W0_9TELE
MRAVCMFLLCILGAAMLSTVLCATSSGPDSCCFSYYSRRIRKDFIISYRITDNRCNKPGVILTTQGSVNICADPSLSWVQSIMRDIDESFF